MSPRGRCIYLVGDGVEERVNNGLGESALLVLVHLHNLPPVRCNLRQVQALAEVDKVQNILLEARTTEADRRPQELGSNSRVETNSMCDFVDVGASRLTNGRKRIDGGDTLCKHGVRRELGQLRRPKADIQNALLPEL